MKKALLIIIYNAFYLSFSFSSSFFIQFERKNRINNFFSSRSLNENCNMLDEHFVAV